MQNPGSDAGVFVLSGSPLIIPARAKHGPGMTEDGARAFSISQ
jgi:hypothetical protein